MASEKTVVSKAFEKVMRSLGEALEHAQGRVVTGLKVHVPTRMDVAGIRKRTGLSQPAFANAIGVPIGTLPNWEQGRRSPRVPRACFLFMLDRNPRIVTETLGHQRR